MTQSPKRTRIANIWWNWALTRLWLLNVEWIRIMSINVFSTQASWWSRSCGKLDDPSSSRLRNSITKHHAVVGQRPTTHVARLSPAQFIRLGGRRIAHSPKRSRKSVYTCPLPHPVQFSHSLTPFIESCEKLKRVTLYICEITACAVATSCRISDVPFQWEKGNFDPPQLPHFSSDRSETPN